MERAKMKDSAKRPGRKRPGLVRVGTSKLTKSGAVKKSTVTKNRRLRPLAIESIVKEEGFAEIIRYASAVARMKGLADISPEILTAGAFFAARDGLLQQRPSISAHLAANSSSVEALIEAGGWMVQASDSNLKKELPLPFGVEIQKALKEADQDSDPLIVALNTGIQISEKLRLKRRVAYHEAGHAVVSNILRPKLGIKAVTIVDKGYADGLTTYDNSSPYFKSVTSREDFLDGMCVELAGRVAEQKKYGHDEVDAGATTDLANATEWAWVAITRWGFDFEFGPVNLTALTKVAATSSGWLFDEAQRLLQKTLKESLRRTETLIAENWPKVEAIAQMLFERKTLTEDEFLTIIAQAHGTTMTAEK